MKKLYLLLLSSHLCFAQTISFEEVLNQAIENSKDLQKQKINIDIAKTNSDFIDGMNFGKLAINSDISRTNHAGYVFMGKLSSRDATFKDFGAGEFNPSNSNVLNIKPKDLNYPDSYTSINSYISYDLPLFTGFALYHQKGILKLQEKANETLYNLDKKNLEFEVLKAYNSAVLAKDFVKTMEKAKDAIEFIEQGAIEFHKNGLVTKIDVNEAKLHLLNTNSSLIDAQNNFKLSLAYLKYLTSNENISDVENLQNSYLELKEFEDLYKIALEKRDEIALQNISIEANSKNIKSNQGSYYPSIFTHLEYGYSDDKFSTSKDKDYYMALLGISLTLFDGTRSANVEKSKLEYLKSKLDFSKLQDGIKLEVEKSLLDYRAKQEILKEKIASNNLALDILNQAKLQYKNRLISMTTLLLQETNYRKSQTMLLNAKYENSLALAKLNLVLGQNLQKEQR
ncbi:transporter [Aliarcobacter trophiarum LMG 25534]|uniref:RND family efflux system, outer membrane channel protein, TolC family n=1 Tax=Aliarcobacter trophiarum LMG 25534 TaxID=1032241 RepID=A0AAD0QKD3_9BACT|nr:TolC family protein [Aliarcobacter trophiarum]AXK49148.1 RND family efflux system, outer membrane channel protein, TolC family [Aliarcobacter trophiarum LMG 25534]RXI26402.1 transporter [Aliarcobacter trophiarum]RXJ89847.1 transporter [Aliarcobacter trophiarum LMG 25534]